MGITSREKAFVVLVLLLAGLPPMAPGGEPAVGGTETPPIRQIRASVTTAYGEFGEVSDAIDILQFVGATRLSDSGDQIWSVPHDKIETVSRFRYAELHPEWDTINTGTVIDTRIPGTMTATVGQKLVQFLGPMLQSDVDAIRGTGCLMIQPLRWNAWQVWAGSVEAAEALRTLECARNPICYRSDYDPVAAMREEFRESQDERPVQWDITMVNDPDRRAADAAHLAQIPGIVFDPESVENYARGNSPILSTWCELPPNRVGDVLALPTMMRMSEAAGVALMGEPESLISANRTHVIPDPNRPPGTTWEVPKLPSVGGTRYAPWLEGKLTTAGNPHFDVPGEYPIVVVTDNGAGNGFDPMDEPSQ